jgi:hypothetical protein
VFEDALVFRDEVGETGRAFGIIGFWSVGFGGTAVRGVAIAV